MFIYYLKELDNVYKIWNIKKNVPMHNFKRPTRVVTSNSIKSHWQWFIHNNKILKFYYKRKKKGNLAYGTYI